MTNPPLVIDLRAGSRVRSSAANAAGQIPPRERRVVRFAGFTLIELLVVIAIIAIIATFVGPAVGSLLRGSQLNQGGQMIQDQLTLYRQLALSKNRSYEVRFYRYSDPSMPGEVVSNPAAGKYRAIQAFEYSADGKTKKPAGNVLSLPTSVVIDSGEKLSTLIGKLIKDSGEKAPAVSDAPLPKVEKYYRYVSFQIKPDGSVALTPRTNPWFLTLHALTDKDADATPPSNFFTIQINPLNGHTTTYRP